MDARAEYKRWLENVNDPALAADLEAIENDEKEIADRFSRHLSFGTAGMRGVLAAGTNRMNILTVSRATQGLADYINEVYGGGSVAVSYDSRRQSEEFARLTAAILCANGVKAFIYNRLMPVPMLSYAVRELKCKAGVMITASHNPAEYNGYKVYGYDGCQLTDDDAAAVLARIDRHDYFDGIRTMSFQQALDAGMAEFIKGKLIDGYYAKLLTLRCNPEAPVKKKISIVFTPLNGAGNEPVRKVLELCGHTKVTVVPEQEKPDGDFPTCPYPNPETAEARALGIRLCEEVKPDIFIATDPDCDRVGAAFREADGSYRSITGNEAGLLMLDYIIRARKEAGTMPERPVAVRSIVSSALSDEIARDGGVEMRTVLTGFKYIGEQILLLEQKGESDRFLFGFEESCGYLSGDFVRDKDGVFASMLLCELTAYYKMKHTTPLEVLDGLYQKYGFYRHLVRSLSFPGVEGADKMKGVMDRLRNDPPAELAGFRVTARDDIKKLEHTEADGGVTPIDLPVSDVLCFYLENGSSVIVRPSGTEPKMKFYITAKEPSIAESDELNLKLEKAIMEAAGI